MVDSVQSSWQPNLESVPLCPPVLLPEGPETTWKHLVVLALLAVPLTKWAPACISGWAQMSPSWRDLSWSCPLFPSCAHLTTSAVLHRNCLWLWWLLHPHLCGTTWCSLLTGSSRSVAELITVSNSLWYLPSGIVTIDINLPASGCEMPCHNFLLLLLLIAMPVYCRNKKKMKVIYI